MKNIDNKVLFFGQVISFIFLIFVTLWNIVIVASFFTSKIEIYTISYFILGILFATILIINLKIFNVFSIFLEYTFVLIITMFTLSLVDIMKNIMGELNDVNLELFFSKIIYIQENYDKLLINIIYQNYLLYVCLILAISILYYYRYFFQKNNFHF